MAFGKHAPNHADDLDRIAGLWGLSEADLARALGTEAEGIREWRQCGIPAERAPAVTRLLAATEMLAGRVKRERIPDVVRRRAQVLGGRSLFELACAGEHEELLALLAQMIDLRQADFH